MGATATLQQPTAGSVVIHNILFATDFSSTSEAALPFALVLAKHYGAALFVTHILPPEPRYELPLEPAPDALNPRKQQAEGQLDALLASGRLNDVVHEPILRCGEFWPTMQEVIASRGIDLIVTGTHGRQGVRKLLLGSVAETIFRRAACPVLTVGPHARLSNGPMRSVVFATDFSPASLAALPYAYSLAAREDAQLTVVHVVQPVPPAVDAVVIAVDEVDLAKDARNRMRHLILGYPPLPRKPEIVTVNGAAADGIIYVASQRKYVVGNADVIVLGVRPKRSVAAHYPWSIADAVVCRALCPVLTVRGE